MTHVDKPLRGRTSCVVYLDDVWYASDERNWVYKEEIVRMNQNYIRDNMVTLLCRGIVLLGSLACAIKVVFF